ncbi:hypothetical protein GCM10012275_24960 [Longimycelium tulufanense]|uniref:Helix-turn-helix domain-containing protein n=1 Tax=Longimycelium tulufanense TaxID=907463 RepID=A0A8J3CDV9_9PSEU|nr:helix-turn-helix domain-containing protein [Longimycelium tulufanense]GGM52980.1 hypothetical protein GCM10012275_24960 [Longimycelium tulufanense]
MNPNASALPQLAYSTVDVAKILGLTDGQVRNLCRTRKLRSRHTGKQYVIPKSAIEEYLAGSDDPISSHGGAA